MLCGDDPACLEEVHILYGQTAAQLDGLVWKDGGPVLAVQVENEFGGLLPPGGGKGSRHPVTARDRRTG